MKFKTQQKSQMPEVNLVPMMDVLLTVLTFFIIVSMTLSSQQRALDVTLPDTQNGASNVKTPDPLSILRTPRLPKLIVMACTDLCNRVIVLSVS